MDTKIRHLDSGFLGVVFDDPGVDRFGMQALLEPSSGVVLARLEDGTAKVSGMASSLQIFILMLGI